MFRLDCHPYNCVSVVVAICERRDNVTAQLAGYNEYLFSKYRRVVDNDRNKRG